MLSMILVRNIVAVDVELRWNIDLSRRTYDERQQGCVAHCAWNRKPPFLQIFFLISSSAFPLAVLFLTVVFS